MSDSMQMSEEAGMNVCVNGESKVPPGFRFHPTEEELLVYYLRKKVGCEKIDLDVIRDVDLNKLEPWDIQEKCKIGSTPQNDWYFFSHKDKKYPTGTRTNRATAAGFWKATGRDKVIYSSFKRIGMRKTLVFYKGRAPHGQKSDWIMHEYRLDDTANCNHDPPPPSTPASTAANNNNLALAAGETAASASASEAGWVVCRVFKKKNYHKALESPQYSTSSTIYSNIMDTRTTHIPNSKNQDPILDQILHYMGKSCKQENETNILLNFTSIHPTTSLLGTFHPKFSHLPRLDSVSSLPSPKGDGHSIFRGDEIFIESSSGVEQATACSNTNTIDGHNNNRQLSDWVALDHLVASQLNCQDDDTSNHLSCYNDLHENVCFSHIDHDLQIPHIHSNKPYFQPNSQVYSSEIDLWSCFTRSPPSSSSSGPLGDVSI